MLNPVIFVSYHNNVPPLEQPLFRLLHVGNALKGSMSKDDLSDVAHVNNKTSYELISDDTGENISKKNREFCEMTGVYWIWKNIDNFKNYTHIGHMQYRRHFFLDKKIYDQYPDNIEKVSYSCVHFRNKIKQTYFAQIGLSELNLKKILSDHEGILPLSGDFSPLGISNLWEDYLERIPGVHIDDLVELRKILLADFPEFSKKFDDYLEKNKKIMYQMFVLTKEDFIQYCNFIFPILFKLERNLNVDRYSINGKRTIGYLAELLYGCYFNEEKKNRKFFETGITFLENI